MKDRDRILAYLRQRISDPSDFYQTHYHLVKDACDKFGADPAEVLRLYEQLQEDAELQAAMRQHHSRRPTRA